MSLVPIHARRYKHFAVQMIHIIIIIITAVVGLIVTIVSALTTGGYTITSFPSIILTYLASKPAATFCPFAIVLSLLAHYF